MANRIETGLRIKGLSGDTNALYVTGNSFINGDVNITGNVNVIGTATTLNTETVQTRDNRILLNYSGTNLTAIGGGIEILSAKTDGNNVSLTTDINGDWNSNTGFNISGRTSDATANGLKVVNSSGTSNFVVRNDGKVGINTSNPNYQLEVLPKDLTGTTQVVIRNTSTSPNWTPVGLYVQDGSGYGVNMSNSSNGQDAALTINSGTYSYLNHTVNGSLVSALVTAGDYLLWRLPDTFDFRKRSNNNTWLRFDSLNQNLSIFNETGSPPSINSKLGVRGSDSSSSNFGLKVQNSGGTDNFVVRNDGNVGIGISIPTAKLQIKDETNSGIPRLQINTHTGNGGTNNKGLYITGNIDSSSDILCLLEHTNFNGGGGNGKIFKATGGNGGNKTTFDIEDKGYVRIGDTGITSNSAVHVKWTPNNFVPISNIGNQDTFGLNIEHLYEVSGQSSNKYGLKIDSTGYYQPANNNYKNYGIFVNTDTGVGTGTTYAAVFNGGNVGIGTSTPSEKLHVFGNTKITGTLNIGTIGSGSPLINLGLDSSGNVVTGTTTTGGGGGIFTGGTISGPTNFTNGLTANTLTVGTFSVGRKFSSSESFTGSVVKTITHNLNTQDVIVQLWDSSNNLLNGATIVANNVNSVDITVATTATYKVVIIG